MKRKKPMEELGVSASYLSRVIRGNRPASRAITDGLSNFQQPSKLESSKVKQNIVPRAGLEPTLRLGKRILRDLPPSVLSVSIQH